MRYYVDTEFNGSGGQLISIGIVRQDGAQFYQELVMHQLPQPWIKENVLPLLTRKPVARAVCTGNLQRFLTLDQPVSHTFVVDWPEDLVHLGNLMVTDYLKRCGPRCWRAVLLHLPGFHAADHSKRPHHALDDAEALRAYVEQGLVEGRDGPLAEHDLQLLRGT